MHRPSSSFLSQDSLHTLFNAGLSQTSHRRKGSRLIVRADTVSLKCTYQQQRVPFGCFYVIVLYESIPHS